MNYDKLYKRMQARVDELESENTRLTDIVRKRENEAYLSYFEHDYSIDYLYKLIDKLPANVYWYDKQGRVLGANSMAAVATRFKNREQLVEKSLYDFSPPDMAEKTEALNKNILESGEVFVGLEEGLDSKGNRAVYHTKKIPIKELSGEIIGIMGLSIDISQRVEQEDKLQMTKRQLEMVSQAKYEFITNMNHDIRTPCTGIIGFAKILLEKETDPQKKKQLGYILESAEKLLKFLDDIFDVISLEDGRLFADATNFNLIELINDISHLFSARINEKNLDFIVKVPPELPEIVNGRKQDLNRVLINLIGNATKFTEKGHVGLIVNITAQSEQQIDVEFQVEDTGIGISDKDQEKIFQKFQRLTAAYQGEYEGAGLGLYIAHQLVAEQNGTIRADSNSHGGVTFTCNIPFSLPSTDSGEGNYE